MPATVSDLQDPDNQGRIKVKLAWAPDAGGGAGYEAWARMTTLFAGDNRGSWFLPDVGDEVLVAFEHGDPRRPLSAWRSLERTGCPPRIGLEPE